MRLECYPGSNMFFRAEDAPDEGYTVMAITKMGKDKWQIRTVGRARDITDLNQFMRNLEEVYDIAYEDGFRGGSDPLMHVARWIGELRVRFRRRRKPTH